LLIGAEWLTDNHGVDVMCCRIAVAKDSTTSTEYLVCSNIYPDGKRRWFAAARQARSYVWQHGRFDGDIEFWQKGLSDSTCLKPVKEGSCLRFFLATTEDFKFFHQAATEKLPTTAWILGSPDEELDEAEISADE
jgi:hypothetical protein